MRNFYLSLGLMLSGSMALAQTPQVVQTAPAAPRAATSAEMAAMKDFRESIPMQRGEEFFCEDFSNGFDGATAYGAWTIEDTGTTPIWMMADENSPAGEFSDTDQALLSTTAENGWVIFDCDAYNTPVSAGVEDVTGWLTSPVIDMSDLGSVIIEWQQVFRYCCFAASPLTVEVTNDGGANWVVFDGHGSFIPAFNTISENPLVSRLDISCAAAGQEAVQVRFGYNSAGGTGYSHYFWGIDDVCIFANPTAHDLEIFQVSNGDIFNIWEYRYTPMSQAISAGDGGVVVGTFYRNVGAEDLTNVVLTVEILDSDENVLSTTTSEPFDIPAYGNQEECPPALTSEMYVETGWEPDNEGDYTVRSSMAGDQVDENDANNSLDKAFTYTFEEYGHSDKDLLDIQLTPRESDNSSETLVLYDPTGSGSFYSFPNEGTAYGVLARFGADSDAGTEFEVRLYKGSDDSPFDANAAEIFGWNFFALDQSWIDGSEEGWIYFPFEDEVEVEATDVDGGVFNVYHAGIINEFESEFQLTFRAQSNSDTDNSSLRYEITGGGDFVWFPNRTATPAVHLVTEQLISVEEQDARSDFKLGQNVPNPANDVTRLPLQMENAHNVTVEVRDMTGKLVYHSYLGTLPAGEHQLEIPTSDLAVGTYTIGVVAGMNRQAIQMVVSR